MRNTLLGICFLLLTSLASAQVIFFVQQPPGLVGSYDLSVGDWSLSPDMLDPADAVTDTLVFVDDGTVGDSLGCNPLVNGADIAGQIAILYRGTCEFGMKALNAQDQGAVAVVIINNIAGAPILMGEGTTGGASVTIPVVMITQASGSILKSEIEAGNVVAFIGNIAGQFGDNGSVYRQDVLMSRVSANPELVSMNATEFNVQLGCWARNTGFNDQFGVTVTGDVSQSGSSLYNQISAPVDIVAGDSAFITLPDFSQSSYSGVYDITYTVNLGVTDEFPDDNVHSTNFLIGDLISFAHIDPVLEMPINGAHYQPTGATGGYTACINYRDANASRLAAVGLHYSATHALGDSLTDELIEFYVYKWNDVFTGLSDPNITVADIEQVGYAEYSYDSDMTGVNYVEYDDPVIMEDDVRYLFCITTYSDDPFIGFDGVLNYDENMTLNDQPVTLVQDAGTWYVEGFGRDVQCAFGVKTINVLEIGITENPNDAKITPYPNPASDLVRIPIGGMNGIATLTITDLTGRTVSAQQVTLANELLIVDVDGIANGTYSFTLQFATGRSTSFNVVISK